MPGELVRAVVRAADRLAETLYRRRPDPPIAIARRLAGDASNTAGPGEVDKSAQDGAGGEIERIGESRGRWGSGRRPERLEDDLGICRRHVTLIR